ncbi:MAG: hypothetical protein GX277_05965, partial [Bacteroidales bacterium]|nr:hypothetical protein [Bacteroidales bacterium]
MKTPAFLIGIISIFIISTSAYAQDLTISGGNAVSVMICSNGAVFSWGNNKMGPNHAPILGGLGTGNTTAEIISTPTEVIMPAAALPIKQVDAGSGAHFVAMGCNGTVWGWGNNQDKQVGNPAYPAAVITTPVQVVKGEGTDKDGDGFLDGVVYISGGNDENYAILETGELVAWGQNDKGQLGNGTTTDSPFPVYVRTANGQTLKNVIMVEAGDETGYALVDNGNGTGTVYSWGGYADHKLGRETNLVSNLYAAPVVREEDGSILNNIVSLTAGDAMGMAIDADGYVWSWGHASWGQMTGTGLYAGHFAARVLGGETGEPFLKAKVISAGQGFGMAVTLDGKAVAWGNNGGTNNGGNLGNGTTTGSPTPVYIKIGANLPITDVVSISDGDYWGFITKADNSIWTWGGNSIGQLGLGMTSSIESYARKMNNPPNCATPDPKPQVVMPKDFSTCVPFSYVINPGFKNNGSYKFEWFKNGTKISGATGETYTATEASASGTTYKVIISYVGANSPCGMDPAEGEVTITQYTPDFTVPSGQTFCAPNFSVFVNGSGTYDYYTSAVGGTYLGTSYKNEPAVFPSAGVTQNNGTTYTVYVEESGNKAGLVKPISSTLNAQEGNPGWIQIQVFEDLTIDSLSFYIKPHYAPFASGGSTGTYQIGVYGQKVSSGVLAPDTDNLLYSGVSAQLTGYSDVSPVPVATLPVNVTLAGSSGGEFYWIGFIKNADPLLKGTTGAYPYVDNVNGNILRINAAYQHGAWAAESPISNLYFHTAQHFCDRIPVTLIEDCPCKKPDSFTINSSNGLGLCPGESTIL